MGERVLIDKVGEFGGVAAFSKQFHGHRAFFLACGRAGPRQTAASPSIFCL